MEEEVLLDSNRAKTHKKSYIVLTPAQTEN